MAVQLPLRVWVVEPRDDVRDLLREVTPEDAELMDETEFRRRIDRGSRPDALLIDGSTLLRLDGQRPALEGAVRTLVVTGRRPAEMPQSYIQRPSVRLLRKPFAIPDIEDGMRWLTGAGDDGWAAQLAQERPAVSPDAAWHEP
jgi:hypothetical protein